MTPNRPVSVEAPSPAPPPASAPRSLARFVDTIDELDRGGPQLEARVRVTLDRMADALAEVPGAPQVQVERIRVLGARLEGSTKQAEVIDDALQAALAGLAIVLPEDDRAVGARYREARVAVDAIDDATPISTQAAAISGALRSIATTMVAVFDTDGALPDARPTIRRDPVAFAKHARALSTLATELSSASSWTEAQRIAADVLAGIATALSTAPNPEISDARLASSVLAIQIEADRLRSADALDFRRMRWMKQGLVIAVTTLETIASPSVAVQSLVRTARAAVDAIDVHNPFELQRAATQNATRVVADALRVLAATDAVGAR